ncbi:MAG: VapC toxin family PIN domain ribonuclease [Thermoplasmata archaeon]|nr:MAG: VapC toxin family PIN domain ribonuclease [Thermoplasmata archaeon]
MYLMDTNVWLERLLDQKRSGEVGHFLDQTPSDQLFITDFSFHSIGIVLSRLNCVDAFLQFVRDAFIDGDVSIVRLDPGDMAKVVGTMQRFKLDFDDAYQYAIAERYGLTIVSFDTDFDRTERGRKTPGDLLKGEK